MAYYMHSLLYEENISYSSSPTITLAFIIVIYQFL